MKIQTDYVVIGLAAAAALYLVAKSRPGMGIALPWTSSAGTGSPENVYRGATLSSIEQQQARNRQVLQQQLASAGDFWV